jgi:hypothetical protein
MAWPHSPLPSFSCVSFRRGLDSSPLLPGGARLTPLWPCHSRPSSPQLPQILKTRQPAPLRHHSACEALLFRHLFTCRCTWSLALRLADGPRAHVKALIRKSPSYPLARPQRRAIIASTSPSLRPLVIVDLPPSHVLCAETNCRPRIASLSPRPWFRADRSPLLETLLFRRFRTRPSRKPS